MGGSIKLRRARNKKKEFSQKLTHLTEDILDDENLHLSSDEDGKIIFLFKNKTPLWLVEELNNRFRSHKDRGSHTSPLLA